MHTAVIARIIIVSAFSLDVVVGGEPYQFFLDIHDMLDSSWIQMQYNVIGTKVQCASLCYQHKDECAYFGYKAGTCYLLKDTVDRNICSQDDCMNSGMKVYKWNVEDLTTTTTKAPTTTFTTSTLPATTTKITETTSTSTTTTTDIPTTTTTEVPSTTTTKASTTSTTTAVTTTEGGTTVTTEADTTTTEAGTTTTTEAGTTTTTEAGTTTTTEAGTTTTTEASTTTTTEASTTTTTTEADTTSTTAMSTTTTTTEGPTTSTTQGPFSCPSPPHGAEPELKCPTTDQLLRQMGSKSPFFGDALGATCTPMNEQIYEDEKDSRMFFGVLPLNTYCPHEHHIVARNLLQNLNQQFNINVKHRGFIGCLTVPKVYSCTFRGFKLCIVGGNLMGATLDCHKVKDPERIENRFNKSTSDEAGKHMRVNCEDKGAIQAIYFMDSGEPPIVKVGFSCAKIRVDDSIEDAVPVTEPSTGM